MADKQSTQADYLALDKVNLFYGQSQILYEVDFKARLGEVTGLIGTNGVGKTSLLKAIAGAHPFKSGTYTLGAESLKDVSSHQLAKRGVGYVPQGRDIFPLLTVTENLETGFACLPSDERAVSDEIYALFPILHEMRNRRGGDLSGGQQQQLAIARALVTKPKLLLLDEPTEGIQPNIIKQIGEVITYLRKQGNMAIVLVEQYFDFAYEITDNFYAMRRGEIILEGRKADLKRQDLLDALAIG